MRGGLLAIPILLCALARPPRRNETTMYAFRKALRAGADVLELDVGVTGDSKVVVVHDTTVDGKTNGSGTVASKTLPQIKHLDAAYCSRRAAPTTTVTIIPAGPIASTGAPPESGAPRRASRPPTSGCHAHAGAQGVHKDTDQCRDQRPYSPRADLRVREECRGLRAVARRREAAAAHRGLVSPAGGGPLPRAGAEDRPCALQSTASPAGSWAPITFKLGETLLEVTTPGNVARAHAEGYGWQNWFSGDDRDAPATWRSLVAMCVDGIMTSRPRALERVLASTERPTSCR